jgi:hypothetical protein
MKKIKYTPRSQKFLEYKHLSFAVTHITILGETMQYLLCVVLPSSLLEGPIVLEGKII